MSRTLTAAGVPDRATSSNVCRRRFLTNLTGPMRSIAVAVIVFLLIQSLCRSVDGRRPQPRYVPGSPTSDAAAAFGPSPGAAAAAAAGVGVSYQQSNHVQTLQPLAVWIDEQQIEKLIGVPMNIYIVRNGAVLPYLKDGMRRNTQLPTLPPDVARIDVSWMAEDDVYTYKFIELKSLDPHVLYDPLINVSMKGTVPKTRSSFHISFPCTLNATAIATMSVVLNLYTSAGQRIPGSPLAFSLRKRCEATASFAPVKRHRKSCRCHNGGSCDVTGRCVCAAGFYGVKCEFVTCRVTCQNGGTCVDQQTCRCPPDVYGDMCQHTAGVCEVPCRNGGTCTNLNTCACPEGYTGSFCQKPICRRWCGVHGKCVGDNFCQCYRGWRGKMCNRTTNRPYDEQETMETRLRRRKRVHASETDPQSRRRRTSGGPSSRRRMKNQLTVSAEATEEMPTQPTPFSITN